MEALSSQEMGTAMGNTRSTSLPVHHRHDGLTPVPLLRTRAR